MRKLPTAILAGVPIVSHSAIADQLNCKGVEMLIWRRRLRRPASGSRKVGYGRTDAGSARRLGHWPVRCIPDNMVGIDAVMIHTMAAQVLAARSEALGESKRASRTA